MSRNSPPLDELDPMDVDSSDTELTGNTENAIGDECYFVHSFDEKQFRASLKQLKFTIRQNVPSETPAAEHRKTIEPVRGIETLPTNDRLQIEGVASAVVLDETNAVDSAIQADSSCGNTLECLNATASESNEFKQTNKSEEHSYASILVHGRDLNVRQHQISDASAHNHDSSQNMESSVLVTEVQPKGQVRRSRLNITVYQHRPSEKAIDSVVETTELRPGSSSAKKDGISPKIRPYPRIQSAIQQSSTEIPIPTTSKENRNVEFRPNVISHISSGFAAEKSNLGILEYQSSQNQFTTESGKDIDLEGAVKHGITSHANDDVSGTNSSYWVNQPGGSPDPKWQNENSRKNASYASDSGDSDIDKSTTESDNFSDIEGLISGITEFKRHKWTPSSSPHRLLVGRSGSWYDGDFDGNCMSGFGTLFSSDRRQFVQGTWRDNKLIDLKSCQFIDQGAEEWTIYLRKQATSYLLTYDEDEFVARAELCLGIKVDFASPFRTIKLAFFSNLTIIEVIRDRLQSNRVSALSKFEKALEHVVHDSINPVDFAFVLITLRKFLKQNSSRIILTELTENTAVSDILRNAAADLLECENMLASRRLEFSLGTQPSKLNVNWVVQSVYGKLSNLHRQRLLDKCPTVLPKLIASISDVISDKIIYISKADIELFHHMASLTKEHGVLKFFEYQHRGLFEKLDKIDSSCSPCDVMPLTTPVYGFLFKSFLEIVSEICLQAENRSETMLTWSDGKWKLLDEIRWSQVAEQGRILRESLNCQYRFIFKLMVHFEPKNYSVGKKFNYDVKVMSSEDADDDLWLLKQFKKFRNRVTGKKPFTDMPEDRKVWLYILDHTIDSVLLKNNSDSTSYLALFKPILEGHITFLSSCPKNSYETFRVVTHNILLFMVQTYPHFQDSEKLTDKDVVILEKQMKYISDVSTDMKSDETAFSDFRNLIDEYNRYWGLRHLITLDESNCPDYLVASIKEIHELSLEIVDTALGKKVRVPALVNYFRDMNDFLEDLKDIDFPSIWFIKSNFDLTGVIEKIGNKIASESKCSYKVIDLKRFVERLEGGSLPRHYIIYVVHKLLDCAKESLSKNWISTRISNQSESEAQLEGTGALLGAIRSSFLYLKEQPDYRDFELFSDESIQPFLRVINNCTVLKEFKIRVKIVKESFWYIRKMDEIGVDQALELFNAINNGSLDMDTLKLSYNRYFEKYNEHISYAKSKNVLNNVSGIVKSMKNEYKDFDEFTDWGDGFKHIELPKILAGLSAVWSLLVSKDVSSSGKFLKPHCIQILCIMRLLSVDNSTQGVEHHLAQVLTGQGKSVILGLLSAFLAFTGYNVQVVCYSSYLADRDETDFFNFYEAFGLSHAISYGTFGDMASELFMQPEVEGRKIKLSNLVKSLVLEHRPFNALGSPTTDLSRTVLMIDEVDVFFSENIYGSTSRWGDTINIPGMPQIQEKIWNTVCGSDLESQTLYAIITGFIDEKIKSGNLEFKEYNKFRLRPGSFSLLDDVEGNNLIVKEYTNRSLLETHIRRMVDTAIIVSRNTVTGDEYRIINGKILSRDPINGDFRRRVGYSVIFSYFKLKKADFSHENFNNYGYIHLNTGRISYAKLPEEFPLVLGVSGTLSNLRDHENEAIKSYNIHSMSALPSFFGESNLKFNQVDNFCILQSKNEWGSKIFEHTNAAIEEQRAVLVFFDTESKLNNFKKDYATKFDRINVLTENTDKFLKAKYIDEAGIARTVTLATRMMGRGVDYKSSMAVEKKGGVHVIQTFFSLDVKEETQIKGRTARKDNKGSYELILCEGHLIGNELLKQNDQIARVYDSLHQTRLVLMTIKGAKNAEKIRKCDEQHNLTMEYYGIGARRQ